MALFGKKYKIGLALSGGAVRGIAHLGVMQAIIEKNINIDILSGTSAGALAGAFYAEGYQPREILDIFSNKNVMDFFHFTFPRSGIFDTMKLKKFLSNNLHTKRIEDLKIPLIIAATNFQKGEINYFDKGILIDSLLASSCIPFLFKTVEIDGMPYIDGGIMDNLPIDPLMGKCKKIIAVHTNPIGEKKKIQNPVQVIERTFHLAIASEIDAKKNEADIFIEPDKLKEFGLFDLKKTREIFTIGYEAALICLS